MSKAAGDWPFAVCEFNRVESWRVHDYILELAKGKDGNRRLDPKVIWESKDSRQGTAMLSPTETQPPPADSESEWVKAANALLLGLQRTINRNSGSLDRIAEQVNKFIEVWPPG